MSVAAGFWRQANLNVARTAAGCAGTQLAGLAFGGATTYNTPINGTESFNGTVWSYTGTLNTARQDIAGFGSATAAMACGGYTGSIYSNASETFNGTVWTAGNAIQNNRSQFVGGGSTLAAFSVGGYNGTTTYNITEKYNGIIWTNASNLITARRWHAGGGTQNSAFVAIGTSGSTTSEVYDGNIWSARGNLSAARSAPVGFGGSSASGIVTGGNDGTQNWLRTEIFDGNVWTVTSNYQTFSGNNATYRMAASGSVTTGGLVIGGDTGGGTGVAGTAAWFVAFQSYSWMTQPPTSVGRQRHGVAGGSSLDAIVFGGYNLASTTERWSGVSWASGGGLSQGKNDPAGTGDAVTTALCIGGNNSGYLTRVESYNGSVWATLGGTLNTARDQLAAAGNLSAALCFGGYTGAASVVTESFDGSAWSNVNALNTARYILMGCGVQGAAISVGGTGSTKKTELWDGVDWTASGDLNTANSGAALSGSSTSARVACGLSYARLSELWSGSAWTASLSPNIARSSVGNGPAGNSTGMLVTGGYINTAGTMQYPCEIYTGAVPVIIDGAIFTSTGSQFIQQSFPPAMAGVASLYAFDKYIGPFFDLEYEGVQYSSVASMLAAQGIMVPFDLTAIPMGAVASMLADLHVDTLMVATLPAMTGSVTLEVRSGTLIRDLPALTMLGNGQIGVVGTVNAYLPGIRLVAAGLAGGIGRVARSLPFFTIISSGGPSDGAIANLTLPLFYINAHGQAVETSFVALVMNPKNFAVSEYEGFSFNSFALFNGQYLGAGAAGIYIIGGTGKDGRSNIDAEIKTGQLAMGTAKPRDVYLSGKSDGQMLVTLSENEDMPNDAKVNYLLETLGIDRAKVPRGMKPDYLQVGIKNVSGADFDLDSMEIYAEGLARKKKG